MGISGYNSYHNSQHFHLFGKDIEAGQGLAATVRMVLLREWDDLNAQALTKYEEWIEEDNSHGR